MIFSANRLTLKQEEVCMISTNQLRSRMKGKLSCPVLKTSGAGDSLAEFNPKELKSAAPPVASAAG